MTDGYSNYMGTPKPTNAEIAPISSPQYPEGLRDRMALAIAPVVAAHSFGENDAQARDSLAWLGNAVWNIVDAILEART